MSILNSLLSKLGLRSTHAWAPTHRHRKGGHYRVICRGVLEADGTDVVIYDDESGKVWVRPSVEFDDGRFSVIAAQGAR